MTKKEIFQYVLGAMIVIVFFVILLKVLSQTVPQQNNEIALIVVGALVAKFGDVVAYFYGSSKGSADKNEMMRK